MKIYIKNKISTAEVAARFNRFYFIYIYTWFFFVSKSDEKRILHTLHSKLQLGSQQKTDIHNENGEKLDEETAMKGKEMLLGLNSFFARSFRFFVFFALLPVPPTALLLLSFTLPSTLYCCFLSCIMSLLSD